MHTTSQVAARLGVNSQTIRRWGNQYKDHMSADSRRGDARQYTDDDLLLLWSVKRWREFGYSLEDITARIAAGERTSDDLPQPAQDSQTVNRAVMIPESQHTAVLAELRKLNADVDRLKQERDEAITRLDIERAAWGEQRQHVTADYNSKIQRLEREIGQLEGQIKNLRPPDYWLRWIAAAVVVAVVLTIAAVIVVLLLTTQ